MNTITKKFSSLTILKLLGALALYSAFIGANSSCVFCYHNPEKPQTRQLKEKLELEDFAQLLKK